MREPLVHFLAVALVLFAANRLLHGSDAAQWRATRSTISEGRVQQIAESYRLLAGRLPSRAELQALVNDFVDEEIGYREAVAMGLDADDTIVRRRMRQKLEFLAEDAEASEEPSEQQLAGPACSRTLLSIGLPERSFSAPGPGQRRRTRRQSDRRCRGVSRANYGQARMRRSWAMRPCCRRRCR